MFEYILHCLRTTYKYFALPHKVTKPNLTKPPSPVTCVSDPYREAKNGGPEPQATNIDKLGNAAVAQDPGVQTSGDCRAQLVTLKNTTEEVGSPAKEKTGGVHIPAHQESSGCVPLRVLGLFSGWLALVETLAGNTERPPVGN